MYLLTYVTLLLSFLAIGLQINVAQSKRISSQQSGVAKAMLDWHRTAVGLATHAVSQTYYVGANSYCLLTAAVYTGTGGGTTYPYSGGTALNTPRCKDKNGNEILVGNSQPSALCSFSSGTQNIAARPCRSDLPANYQKDPYVFYSVLYTSSVTNQSYVFTFVPPPKLSGSAVRAQPLVCLPGQTASNTNCQDEYRVIAVTLDELYRQLNALGLPSNALGYVDATNHVLKTGSAKDSGGTLNVSTVPLPTITQDSNLLRDNSVGIASPIIPCPSSSQVPTAIACS